MHRARGRRIIFIPWSGWILPMGALILSACVPFVTQRLEPLDSQTEVVLLEETRRTALRSPSWQTGVRAFEEGDYTRAKEVFESLAAETGSDDLRRKARYALACTQLALAQDPEAFRQAMASWEGWRQSMPREMFPEDPRMLAPLLRRIPPPGKPGATSVQRPRPEASPDFKRMLETKEEEIRLKQDEIRSQEEEIQRLKEQLDALEAIHRSIEEKKRGVNSR